ncbi:MAG: ROK family transcriptional regulator [Bosea sp.]|nr:ROK family transcriptional regulator [Bosea sp. (in: a-proteobacteria)]
MRQAERTMNDLTGSNSELAASHNRGVILRAIQRHQPISRTELAQRSGLTKQTVTRIAERLIGEKLVLEARRRHGQPGQPSIELEINPDGCHSIGAYIARDHVAVVAIDASGAVRGRIHTEVAFALPEQAIGLIEEAFATFKRRRTIDERRLAGLGIALPDWLGEIPFPGMPAAYASWTGYDVRGRVAAFTDLPLYIENDAIAAAIGELNYGLGVESRSFFYIFIGSGLGGAVVLDGVCHHGVTGLSGEIGWLPTLAADMPEGSRIQPLGQLVSLYVLYEFMAAHGITITAPGESSPRMYRRPASTALLPCAACSAVTVAANAILSLMPGPRFGFARFTKSPNVAHTSRACTRRKPSHHSSKPTGPATTSSAAGSEPAARLRNSRHTSATGSSVILNASLANSRRVTGRRSAGPSTPIASTCGSCCSIATASCCSASTPTRPR